METTPYIPNEAVAALQKMIQSWLDENPKRTRSALARGAGVAEATLRRIANDGTLPQPYNIAKIVSFIKGVSSNREIIENSGPSLSQVITYHLPYTAFESTEGYVNLPQNVEALLNTNIKRLIFVKSGACEGLSPEEIVNDFGRLGVMEAKELLSAGLLSFENEKFKITEILRNYSLSPELSKETIVATTSLYFKADVSTNYSFNITEGVSLRGYNEVMDTLQAAHLKISQIVKNNPGSFPLFTAAVMDTMTTKSLFSSSNEDEI